jgi:hypothetical protein
MSDDINRPMPPAASGRRRRRIRIPIVSLLVFIISAVVAAPAAAAGKTVDGGTVVHATALWSAVDGQGDKVVTQLDLVDGIVYDESHRPKFGQGTTIELTRTVIDPSGHTVYTGDSFFGTLFTMAPVFHTDKVGTLRSATLAPVKVDQCVLGPSPCKVIDRSLILQTNWTGTGPMGETRSTFRDDGSASAGPSEVRMSSDAAYRSAPATGTLNGKSLGEPTTKAALSRTSQVTAISGELPGIISIPDYLADTIDLGNKTTRGGKGTAANAAWVIPNADGSTTYYQLTVVQGSTLEGRVVKFVDETFVSVDKRVVDRGGNTVDFAIGSAVSPGSGTFTAKKDLKTATLAPITVKLTSCPGTGGCTTDKTATIKATWAATSKPVTSAYRYTGITTCKDSQCTTADPHHDFSITATGASAAAYATATATFDGVDLGASTTDQSVGTAFVSSGGRSTIEYGGSYPINIYPIQAPKAPPVP